MTPIIPADRQVIDTYAPGRFRISNVVHEGSVIVMPDRTLSWSVENFGQFTVESLEPVLTAEPKVEILLIGTGERMQLLHSSLRRQLKEAGIVADVMDTRAACRTYNVLLSEARRVAAVLIPI
ncbi:Mth938-like domain-containing protein [Indioceanicola profundi]|uniref:Mth938-like domain-containing protein n=1 Tax=Indioceanicola profundi TaxID=2220096 RepID=UPI00298DD344|nr:Mth938-like domain-containing protein [Indioceanicola profundi]